MSSFALANGQSVRELFSGLHSAPATTTAPATLVDPPRPAKEGYEWVWFPAGYWAEREIAETPTKDAMKVFRWRNRSGKSSAESPNRSPHTALVGFASGGPGASLDLSAKRRSLTRAPRSSESGSFFPLNRIQDYPLSSPYLTEEAHVQSLQSPSIDTIAGTGSVSGGSILRSRAYLSPSPLHLSSAEEEIFREEDNPSPLGGRSAKEISTDTTNVELPAPEIIIDQKKVKPKRSFINWRVLSEHRQVCQHYIL